MYTLFEYVNKKVTRHIVNNDTQRYFKATGISMPLRILEYRYMIRWHTLNMQI